MPRGVALSLQFRILIYRRVQAGFSAQEIFELGFRIRDEHYFFEAFEVNM